MKYYNSLKQIRQEIASNTLSCEKLVEGYLENIAAQKHINAFIETYNVEARDRACLIDQKIKNKTAGKLAGLVIGIKDNICYKGHKSTASSKILQKFESTYSATVIERLISEDAIILGRLNCDEFAMGSSTEQSFYGPTKNPIDPLYVPGGSSGGSAAAVKANLCHAALGTDTGGSIRQPSAFCGVIGLKPTYGLVSRHGLIAYASSFDQIGPIAKSAQDIVEIMNVISGEDNFDSTCIAKGMVEHTIPKNDTQHRFAVIKQALEFPEINPEIKIHFEELIDKIKKAGHIVDYINLPLLDYLVPAYYILTTAEASSNLSRYDGIKYGYQQDEKQITSLISKTRTKGFGIEVKRRILLGTFVLSEGYYDAYYSKAQQVRKLIKDETQAILSKHDYILLPTTPNLPFKIGQHSGPTELYNEDVFTVQANLSGHPSLAIPIGMTKNHFFSSAQLIGPYFSEHQMLHIADTIILN
mgnify:CR=1 FL=1